MSEGGSSIDQVGKKQQKVSKSETKIGGGLRGSRSSSSAGVSVGRATRQTAEVILEEEKEEEEEFENGEEEDPEVELLLPGLKAITATSASTGNASTGPHTARQNEPTMSSARVHMLHLLDAVKMASVDRYRTDHEKKTNTGSTFDQGVSLLTDAITARPHTTPTTAARRLAYFVDRTLGWRERHLNSHDEDVQRRVRVYGNGEDLSAIFLRLVKVGAFDEP